MVIGKNVIEHSSMGALILTILYYVYSCVLRNNERLTSVVICNETIMIFKDCLGSTRQNQDSGDFLGESWSPAVLFFAPNIRNQEPKESTTVDIAIITTATQRAAVAAAPEQVSQVYLSVSVYCSAHTAQSVEGRAKAESSSALTHATLIIRSDRGPRGETCVTSSQILSVDGKQLTGHYCSSQGFGRMAGPWLECPPPCTCSNCLNFC